MTDSAEHHDNVDHAVEQGQAMLRQSYRGTLQFDEHFVPMKYVIDPVDGRLVAPAMVAMLTAAETIFFVPEEDEKSLQMLVSLEELDGQSHPCTDRWRMYHGEPEDVRWTAMWIDMAKLTGAVIDGDALMGADALIAEEPSLCSLVNADREALIALCASRADLNIESPLCVGVNETGLDIRARFDIVRVLFDEPIRNGAAAADMIEHMLEEASEH